MAISGGVWDWVIGALGGSRSRRRLVMAFVLAAAAVASGCSTDSQHKLDEIDRNLQSWGNCIDLVQEQWNERKIPETYVRQIVKAANKGLTEQQKQIRAAAGNRSLPIAQVEAAARNLQSKIDKLGQVVTTRTSASE